MTAQYEQWPMLGVEEEYFLVTPGEGEVEAGGSRVIRRARDVLGEQISGELTEYQVEARTPPCVDLDELYFHLARMRTAVTEAAAAEGLRVIASGTPIIGAREPAPIREDQCYQGGYQGGLDAFRALNDDYTVGALHTHVHVPVREHAVLVSNHLRPWLPTLIAMSANSPFWGERDSGYASWRTIAGSRWPVAGPPPYFASLAHYDQIVAALMNSGAALDQRTLLWDVRPCAHLPTVEVRALDATASVEEAAVFASLIRALVMTALGRVRDGDAGPRTCDALLRAAYWRAARDGWAGHGVDPRTGQLVPVTEMARRLLEDVRPALDEFGDLPRVTAVLRRLAVRGGAGRQRAAFARRGSLRDVVDHLVEHTAFVPDGGHETERPLRYSLRSMPAVDA
jgi:carboxylate-amine ligase